MQAHQHLEKIPRVPKNGPAKMPPELRRFHHFKGLTLRGLRISKQQPLLHCYYSIHEVPNDKEPLGEPIYVSEVIYNTLNPQWCTIPPTVCGSSLDRFVIYIWDCSGPNVRHIIKTTVILSSLMYIESEEDIIFPPNTLFFQLFDGLYCSPSVRKALIDSKQILPLPSNVRTTKGQKTSFSLTTFASIIKQQEELQAKQAQLARLSSKINEKLQAKNAYFNFVSKKNMIQDEKDSLTTQLEQKRQAIEQDHQQLTELSKSLLPRVNKLKDAELKLIIQRKQMEQEKKNLELNRHKYHEVLFCQRRNTLHLIKELVPLRYPMVPKCSRSSISDPITNLGQYPLYARGVDSVRFQYALFLLNKNIEQLIESQDIDFRIRSAMQLRETLPNLYRLIAALAQKRSQINAAVQTAARANLQREKQLALAAAPVKLADK